MKIRTIGKASIWLVCGTISAPFLMAGGMVAGALLVPFIVWLASAGIGPAVFLIGQFPDMPNYLKLVIIVLSVGSWWGLAIHDFLENGW